MNKLMLTAARHWKLLSLFNFLLLAITFSVMVFSKKTWTAESKLILPKPTTALNADLGTLGNINSGQGAVFSQQLNALKILSSIITSKDALREVWQQDKERDLYPRLEQYQKLFVVTPQNESTILEISVEGSSPELAKQRTEALMNAFRKRLQSLRAQEVSQRAEFLKDELATAEEKLRTAEQALNDYKGSANVMDNDLQAQEILSGIKTLSTERSQVTAQIKANREKVRELSARLNMTPEEGLQSLRLGENSEYTALKQSVADVEARLAGARVKFLEDSPQVQNLLEEKQKLNDRLASYGGANLTSSRLIASSSNSSQLVQEMILADSAAKESQERAQQLGAEIANLNLELRSLPGKQKRLVELKRSFNTAEGIHNGLVAQIQESKLSGLSSYPNVQTLDVPDVDSKPSKPKKSLVALGFLLTSFFGSSAILLFLDRNQSLLDTGDISDIDIPTLANIPDLKDPQQDIRLNEQVVMEFQRLALAVSMLNLDRDRLLISSTTAGEGKSTVVLGLAYALADLGFQVLMVDADYRQAGLSRSLGFDLEQDASLTTLEPARISPRIDLIPTTSRPNNIAEFIARGAFESELDIIQQQGNYDYILIDSPPVSLASEAVMMARIIDHLLYVVRPGLTDSNEFFSSLELIDIDKVDVAGLVVNGINIGKTYLSQQKKAYLPQSLEQ